ALDTCEAMLMLTGVPASTCTPGFDAAAVPPEGCFGLVVVLGVDEAGLCDGALAAGSGFVCGWLYCDCGVMSPAGCSTGFEASRLSLPAVDSEACFWEQPTMLMAIARLKTVRSV